jgi:hypothetical protein
MHSFNRRRALVVMMTSILLIAATEALCLFLAKGLPTEGNFISIREKMTRAAAPGNVDILVFGDSTALLGVSPAHLQSLTNKTAYNFATDAHISGFSDIALLRTYLETHPRPMLVIKVFSIEHAIKQPDASAFHALLYQSDVAPIVHTLPGESWAKDILATVFPSFKNRDQIRANLQKFGSPEIPSTLQDGFEPVQGMMKPPTDDQLLALPTTESDVFEADFLLEEKFCEIAQNAGVPVYIRLGPVEETAYAKTNVFDFSTSFVSYLRERLANYSTCYVEDAFTFFNASNMYDLTHTNHTGALLFTKSIVERLRQLNMLQSN